MDARASWDRLRRHLEGRQRTVVALSGGVGSGLLARAAWEVLGRDAVAATVAHEAFPERERRHARRVAREVGIRHVVVPWRHLLDPGYVENRPDRCFRCRSGMVQALQDRFPHAAPRDFLVGATADPHQQPPGVQATRAAGWSHPHLELGLDGATVRAVSHLLGLSVADRPPMPCLSSRLAPGLPVTRPVLERVDAAERWLLGLGLPLVRVRVGRSWTCIEAPPECLEVVRDAWPRVQRRFHRLRLPPPNLGMYPVRQEVAA